ncbi:Thiol-disulfide interchange protein, contains DsbC and DsbD domains [Beijerinckia sp. 28-YEA-48]|nr:Thiol-disulfide interchange protein, contains DsbC and DsbD domains [Beijerinckia sp. 28-YEA-48]
MMMRHLKTTGWLVGTLLFAFAAAPAAASDGASPWTAGPNSRARLVSAGPMTEGVYRAGVQIKLEGQALTYWRMPGEAGVPPTFDFTKSVNLAAVDVAYPAPFRLEEAGQEAFGYRHEVIFPLRVKPVDPTRPVQLDLHLNYAACEKICIPAEANLQITLTPGAAVSARAAQHIAVFEAQVPKSVSGAEPPVASVVRLEGPKPKWSLRFEPPLAAEGDVFAEGPEGWFFDTKRNGQDFDMILAQKPKGATLPVRVVLTYRDGTRAYERAIHLDAAASSP